MIENRGFVYVLMNDAMPGVVKIGRTSREVEVRAGELWQTGVPVPFRIHAEQQTIDCVQLEAYMHGELRERRAHRSREFFHISPEDAALRLRRWALVQAHGLILRFFSGFNVVPFEHWVADQDIERIASEHECDPRLIADAMALLTKDEIAPALQRAVSRRGGDLA